MPEHQGNYELDLEGSFLEDLPPLIKRYTYRDKLQFFSILESERARFESSTDTSKFILFHANEETIENIFAENEDTSIARFCNSFDTNEQLFLVKMVSQPHSVAAYEFNTMIVEALRPMGLHTALRGYQGATIRSEGQGRRGNEADFGWGPKGVPPGQPRSPSVTLEVAFSESEPKLNSDVRFWLNPDEGKANICSTLRIDRARPQIRIETWERRNENSRIHRSQVTWITMERDRVDVTHSPLTISFESLFRRPSSRPGETDLEFSEGQLEELAKTIWEEQGWI